MLHRINQAVMLCLFLTVSAFGEVSREGTWYGYFGWNRSAYLNSDIHFTGNDHDFSIYDVKASDRPNPWSDLLSHYLNPLKLTIPQYNLRVGYFLSENTALSVGIDHMKYVMDSPQTLKLSGSIDASMSQAHQKAPGTPAIQKTINPDFLSFEHTNGYNLYSLDLDYIKSFYQTGTIDIAWFTGVGLGVVIPKSDVKLMGKKRRDEIHFAGVDLSLKLGSEVSFGEHYFLRAFVRAGQSRMFDILTTYDGGKATQNITHAQAIAVLGARF